jgi:hypothetical protein
MPFVDSRLGPGTLTIGATPGEDFSTQIANCRLVPTADSTDGTPTLATPEPPPLTTTSYALQGDAIADFSNPTGFNRFCFDNDGVEMDFVFTPNTDETTPATLTGKLTVRAFEMGGDVAVQISTSFEFPVTGKPVWAGGTTPAAAAAGKRGSK